MALIKKKTPKDKRTVLSLLKPKKPEYFENHRWLRMTAVDHKRHSKNVVFRAVLDLFAKQVGIQRLTRCAPSNPPSLLPRLFAVFSPILACRQGGWPLPLKKVHFLRLSLRLN